MVILGLGSNMGDRLSYLRAAAGRLAPLISAMRCSPIYESQALLPKGAAADWNTPFFNMAISGNTALSPEALLAAVKQIERDMGRQTRDRWAPREIDIDILVMDNMILTTPMLSLPHSELLARDFALLPLADLAPDWRYPSGEFKGQRAADIARAKNYKIGETLRATELMLYD